MHRRRPGFALSRPLELATWLVLLLGIPALLPQEPRGAGAQATTERAQATDAERKDARRLVQISRRLHYGGLVLDDAMASRLLDRFLETLDPLRAYLLASDVEGFQGMRTRLDDDLAAGKVDAAYEVFARFQERRLARLADQVTALDRDLPTLRFDGEETLELDRSKVPWAASPAELDELWRRFLMNDVLELRLGGRALEDQKEILSRRYANQLERAQRTRAADVFDTFLNAFASLMDPHTEYFAPRQAQDFDISMSLSLQGIGALIGGDGSFVRIDEIIPGGPADRGGELHPTDRILGVAQGEDGEMVDVRGWRPYEAVELIRGKKGTLVRLQILSGDQPESAAPHEVRVVRDEVRLEDQAAKSRVIQVQRDGHDFSVGVIELPAFYLDFKAYHAQEPDYRSATRDVARLVDELTQQGIDALVVDLRGNGGGSLTEAQELANLFLGPGPVVQIRDAAGQVEVLGGDRPSQYDGPLAVLVNRLSASASEIFSAAVQDRGRGVVLGGRTFGKGTVQQVVPLAEGQLKITQAKFYRVSGGSTQHRGVTPDVLFPETFDDEVIGESALDDALPWDSIDAVLPSPVEKIAGVLGDLRRHHEARTAADPDFLRATELLAFQREQRAQTEVSLNEERRRQERDALEARLDEIDARWRKAKGLPEKGTGEENDKNVAEGADEEQDPGDAEEELTPERRRAQRMLDPHLQEADAYQKESGEVLVDLILSGATRPGGPPWIDVASSGR